MLLEIFNKAKLTSTEIKQVSIWITPGCDHDFCDFYDSSAFTKLYEYFAFTTAEMPYGTATGDTGEPDIWILERLAGDL